MRNFGVFGLPNSGEHGKSSIRVLRVRSALDVQLCGIVLNGVGYILCLQYPNCISQTSCQRKLQLDLRPNPIYEREVPEF